jgi:hypothetical protein
MPFCSVSLNPDRNALAFQVLYFVAEAAVLINTMAGVAAQGQTRLSRHDAIQQAQSSPTARIAQGQVSAAHGRQICHPVDESVELSDSIDTIDSIPYEELTQVLAQRQDVMLAQDAVAAAEADLKLQKSLGVPDFDLLGGSKRNSGADTLYSALQIPLRFTNRNQEEVQRAAATVHVPRPSSNRSSLSCRQTSPQPRRPIAGNERSSTRYCRICATTPVGPDGNAMTDDFADSLAHAESVDLTQVQHTY